MAPAGNPLQWLLITFKMQNKIVNRLWVSSLVLPHSSLALSPKTTLTSFPFLSCIFLPSILGPLQMLIPLPVIVCSAQLTLPSLLSAWLTFPYKSLPWPPTPESDPSWWPHTYLHFHLIALIRVGCYKCVHSFDDYVEDCVFCMPLHPLCLAPQKADICPLPESASSAFALHVHKLLPHCSDSKFLRERGSLIFVA